MSAKEKNNLNTDTIQKMLNQKKARMKLNLAACASCSLCAESCFLFESKKQDPRYMPSYKVIHSLGKLYKKKGKVDRAALDEMKDLVWKNCVLCERCYCAFGIDIPSMIAFTRSILRSQGISGVYPHTFGAPEDTHEEN